MTEKDWSEILGWGQDQFDDLRYIGYAYIRQGKYDIALPFFKALVIVDGETAYNMQMLGAIYLEMSRGKDATKYLRKALRYEPNNKPTILNLTKALLMQGQKSEALDLARQLRNCEDREIARIAKALLLAHS